MVGTTVEYNRLGCKKSPGLHCRGYAYGSLTLHHWPAVEHPVEKLVKQESSPKIAGASRILIDLLNDPRIASDAELWERTQGKTCFLW